MRRRLVSILGLLMLTFALMTPASSVAATPYADLGVSHLHSPHTVRVGQLITFRIGARNYGPSASQLDVYMDLSTNLEPVDVVCDFGISSDGLVCEYSNVPAGRSTTTLLTVRVLDAPGAGFWLNVTLMNEGDQSDPNPRNDTAQVGGRIR